MNECLCKPIDINRLCGFFLSDDVTLSLARSTISESYSSDVVLNSVGAINRYAGRLELLVKAYELFLRDAGAYINKISSTASNPQELGDLVHKLKGVAGMIGADRLAHACELFEKMLYDQSEDCKCIDMVKSELSSVLKQTKIEVEQQLSSC
jgi:HPt (histidine-containing phosphotransfer) domain-containing protein